MPFGTRRRSWLLPVEARFKFACCPHRLYAIGDVQFLKKCREMKLNRFHTQPELLRDLLVGQPFRKMVENLLFSDAESKLICRSRPHYSFHQYEGSELGCDEGLAGMNGLYGRH